jgi:hypothetical protein
VPDDSAGLDAAIAELMRGAPERETPAAGSNPTVSEMTPPASTPDPESADAEAPPPPETVPLASLKDLAAKAGLEVKQLYDMELPGIEGMTLGQVKDRAKELLGVDATRESVESERAGLRAERLKWTRELAAAQSAGLHSFSEPERAEIGKLLQRHADAEAATILSAVPEWKDATTLRADFEGITERLAKKYAVSPTEVALVMESHAWIALELKDALDRNRRLVAAQTKVKTPPKKLQQPAGNVPPRADQLQRIYENPKSSAIDRGLAALLQGAKR